MDTPGADGGYTMGCGWLVPWYALGWCALIKEEPRNVISI